MLSRWSWIAVVAALAACGTPEHDAPVPGAEVWPAGGGPPRESASVEADSGFTPLQTAFLRNQHEALRSEFRSDLQSLELRLTRAMHAQALSTTRWVAGIAVASIAAVAALVGLRRGRGRQ